MGLIHPTCLLLDLLGLARSHSFAGRISTKPVNTSGIFIEAEGFGSSIILSASPLTEFSITVGLSIKFLR